MEIGLEALRLYYNGQVWREDAGVRSTGQSAADTAWLPKNRWLPVTATATSPKPDPEPTNLTRGALQPVTTGISRNWPQPSLPTPSSPSPITSVSHQHVTNFSVTAATNHNNRLLPLDDADPSRTDLSLPVDLEFAFPATTDFSAALFPQQQSGVPFNSTLPGLSFTDSWSDGPMVVNVHRFLLTGGFLTASDNATAFGNGTNFTGQNFPGIDGDLTRESGAVFYNFWALIAIVFILAGLVGNVLVCLAVTTDRRLQTPTNYFLLSLAVADLLVSVLVMPIGMSVEIMGYWPFNFPTCVLYSFSDIFCCTASIMHMCMISIDRYMGISRPLTHRTRSVKFDIGMKIAAVWLISFAVSCPVIFVSVFHSDTTVLTTDRRLCALDNKIIMIVGSLLAFFIPQLVMTIMMTKTLLLLRQQAKWSAGKRGHAYQPPRIAGKRSSQPGIVDGMYEAKNSGRTARSDSQGTNMIAKKQSNGVIYNACAGQTEAGGGSNNSDSPEMEDDPGSSGSTAKTPNARNAGRIVAAINMLNRKNKQKKARQIDSEKKATTVLGLVFGIFCLCWTPFFIMNTVYALCADGCNIPVMFFTFFLWLGWVSSTVNPMIYTVVNPNFRQAFFRLLSLGMLGKRCRGAVRVSVQNFCGDVRPENPKTMVIRRASKYPRPDHPVSWSPTFLTALELNNETPV